MPDAHLTKSSSAALHDLRTVASWLEASGGGAPEDRAHWVGVLRAAADSLEGLATMSPAFSTKDTPAYHRCVDCGATDHGQRDWGLDHAQRCGGHVPRPPGWHTSSATTEQDAP